MLYEITILIHSNIKYICQHIIDLKYIISKDNNLDNVLNKIRTKYSLQTIKILQISTEQPSKSLKKIIKRLRKAIKRLKITNNSRR